LTQLKLVIPLFLIFALPLIYAYADSSGDLSIILGKTYLIHYEAKDSTVQNVIVNKEYQSLSFSVQAQSSTATLQLTLPRELIDAKKSDGTDEYFIVLVDGAFATSTEKNTNLTSRTIVIQMAPDSKLVEVIGTRIGSPDLTNKQNNTESTQKQEIPQEKPIIQKPTKNQTKNSKIETSSIPTPTTTQNTTESLQGQILQRISSLLHFDSGYLPFHVSKTQAIEYWIMISISLVVVITIASSVRVKKRKSVYK